MIVFPHSDLKILCIKLTVFNNVQLNGHPLGVCKWDIVNTILKVPFTTCSETSDKGHSEFERGQTSQQRTMQAVHTL